LKVIYGLENLKKLDRKSAVTIGVFDGVHLAHRQIIKHVIEQSKQHHWHSVLITFDPHPLDLLKPKTYPTILTGLNLKLHLIERLGIEIVVIIKFTKAFSKMRASKFIEDVLVDKLQAAHVAVGAGFKFGYKSQGTVEMLKEAGAKYDFSVKEVPPIKTFDGLMISSTRIRNLLKAGELEQAKRLLGHQPIISGTVIAGKGYGSQTGFHTANIETADKASVPKEGVYAGFVMLDDKKLQAVVNIGPSPTFEVTKKRIEAHVLEYDKPLYDRELELELICRLRDIKKFPNTESLSAQIEKDIAQAKKIFAGRK